MTATDSDTAAVIVNFRTKELTRDAAASALVESIVKEVVVVDNASGDGSADFLRAALPDERVRVVECKRNDGFAQGVNVGVANSESPLILILNSDATLRPAALPALVAALGDESVGVAAPAIYGPDGAALQSRAYGRFPRRREIVFRRWSAKARRNAMEDRRPEWVSGVAMLVRRTDFAALGGFDERFNMYFEDVDFCQRIHEQGKSVVRVTSAGVVHLGGRSWQVHSDQVRCFHESKFRYFAKQGARPFDLRCIRLLGLIRTTLSRRPGPPAL